MLARIKDKKSSYSQLILEPHSKSHFSCYHSFTRAFLSYRAEKERSQYFGEVNDLRHSLDQVANEKV